MINESECVNDKKKFTMNVSEGTMNFNKSHKRQMVKFF